MNESEHIRSPVSHLRCSFWFETRKCVSVEEQVAMFISVLAHHQKNRVVKS